LDNATSEGQLHVPRSKKAKKRSWRRVSTVTPSKIKGGETEKKCATSGGEIG